MENFNSILSILLPGLVKYENVVNKIYTIVNEILKQYNNNKYLEYNNNKQIILDKLESFQKPIQGDINFILHILQDIHNVKNLINTNFGIVTIKSILHTIKNEFSETKTNTIDKKILEVTNIFNNIETCENVFINKLIHLFIEYFDKNNKYIDSIISDKLVLCEYINKLIIGIINFYKYNPEYIERNKQVIEFLYNSIYDLIYKTTKIKTITHDIWYIPNLSNYKNRIIYKLENLLIARTPALHIVNGISNDIVTQFNTILIAPNVESKYKIIKNYNNIYFKNYLRDAFINTDNTIESVRQDNIKFADTSLIIKRYIEWKETNESVLSPSSLIQILTKNFNKQLDKKIESFSDFTNLICGDMKQNIYNTYIIQSFSEFYFESVNKLVAAQFVSSHTNILFDNQVACDNNFMKEAFISNLINIKSSTKVLQKKILDAVNTTFKSDILNILKYYPNSHNNKITDAWLTLFKSIIKSIVDPDKNIKSKFVEKINILIPKANLKHFIMKNPKVILN